MNDQVKDLFDFADLSDLPEELAEKLTKGGDDSAREWGSIVLKGADRGYTELSINQIIAVASRMGMEIPTQQTVRNYLNRAVELRVIGKPTRMTYGPVGATSAATAGDESDAGSEDVDPLAGI